MATDSRGLTTGFLITADTIVGVQTRSSRGRLEVISRGAVATPPGSVEGANVLDPPKVAQAIRALRKELGQPTRSATVALVAPGYAFRMLRVPDVPVGERRTLVRGQLEELGSLPYGGGAFDFLWIPAPPDEGRRQADCYAYFTSDAQVDEVRETLRLAGLQLGALEPASLAAMRAYLMALGEPKATALLFASEKHSDLCIHDGNRVRHLRRIPAGWSATGQTAEVPMPAIGSETPSPASSDGGDNMIGFDLDAPAAPAAQAVMGGAVGIAGEHVASEEAIAGSLQRAATTEFLASEIARSLAFHAREFPDSPRPEALAVIGIADEVAELRNGLAKSLTMSVVGDGALAAFELPRPVESGRDSEGAYLAALGAAFGDVEGTIPSVDISQQEMAARARRRAPSLLLAGMAGSTIWMIAAAAAAITLSLMEDRAKTENSSLASEIARIKAERAPKLRYKELLDGVNDARSKSEIPAPDILGRVAAAATPGVALKSLKAGADGKVNLDGEAMNTSTVQQFINTLNKGRTTKSPYFQRMQRDKDGRLTFTIVGTFKDKGR